ncbi:DNA replication complex GINS protein PSF2 isoform X1 [Carica papaya]|uniref:DNA replication complex GINS protein PSF2 isoform X1 n=1 Tax=Carica papaya TaxID=3649 RepID=UPI000B8C7261|nr:DNA replication complex GINS protein PSF2 isoform X1 [Carica papaya]
MLGNMKVSITLMMKIRWENMRPTLVPEHKKDTSEMDYTCFDDERLFGKTYTKRNSIQSKKDATMSPQNQEFNPISGYEESENLTNILEGERESQVTFQALPFHYVEISRLLFDHARDDIPDIYMVRSLVEDIRDVRLHKIETNLETFSGTSAVKVANLSAMEVNIVRPFVRRALQAFYKHDKPEPTLDRNERPQRRQEASNEPRRHLRQR